MFSRISHDERTLLNSGDDDIVVVSQLSAADNGEETLATAMRRGKPVICVKHRGLARDTSCWLKVGDAHAKASVTVATVAGAMSLYNGDSTLAKVLAVTGILLCGVYHAAWRWDTIYAGYHLLENRRLLTLLGSRYRHGVHIILLVNGSVDRLFKRHLSSTVPMASFFFAFRRHFI